MDSIQFKILGESAITVVLGNEISEAMHNAVMGFEALLNSRQIEGIVETVPAYCSLTVHYVPHVLSYHQLLDILKEVAHDHGQWQEHEAWVVELPVLYGGQYGPDLGAVACHCGMTQEQVIACHSGRDYLIYMLGFTPGFPYLGGMDEALSTPRLQVPRTRIEPGSVGIAGSQTGVYSVASPGGWQIIGKTPVHLYDPKHEPRILLQRGQYIRFVPTDKAEFQRIAALSQQGQYQCKTYGKAVRV